MGSASDRDKMAPALRTLEEFGLEATEHVVSAHRTPDAVVALARSARDDGYGALICGAGMAAALPGGIAAAAAAAVEKRPKVSLPATPRLLLPPWPRVAAVERTPAAVRAHGTHRGARLTPRVNTRQSSQKGRRQARQVPAASSNRCLS